ncbi:MAG: hypothetical protein MJ065_06725 [Oscillospiraceae bacterium]|nr:hypothetical protein [Oscillospiraceae bacterium]
MKKRIWLAGLLTAAVLLTACSANDKQKTEDTPKTTGTEVTDISTETEVNDAKTETASDPEKPSAAVTTVQNDSDEAETAKPKNGSSEESSAATTGQQTDASKKKQSVTTAAKTNTTPHQTENATAPKPSVTDENELLPIDIF